MPDDSTLGRVRRDLLDLSDFAYGRLRDRLDGLTDDEYLWEPAADCWSVRPVDDGTYRADGPDDGSTGGSGEPPLTTLAWRMSHLIDVLGAGRNATWIGVTPAGRLPHTGAPGTAGAAVERLGQAYALFRAHIAAVDAGTLTDAMGAVAGPYAQSTRASFVLHELDELIHHGAEVGVLRDLYRATHPA
jgi:hypothetical protein